MVVEASSSMSAAVLLPTCCDFLKFSIMAAVLVEPCPGSGIFDNQDSAAFLRSFSSLSFHPNKYSEEGDDFRSKLFENGTVGVGINTNESTTARSCVHRSNHVQAMVSNEFGKVYYTDALGTDASLD